MKSFKTKKIAKKFSKSMNEVSARFEDTNDVLNRKDEFCMGIVKVLNTPAIQEILSSEVKEDFSALMTTAFSTYTMSCYGIYVVVIDSDNILLVESEEGAHEIEVNITEIESI
ncbi:hypothetical protein [Diaphorobacter aerolatus]|uniref:Uncharacterized protein n=1 Tax=Diaphorobacter aerolatus TaxID=1288495 RepID=A0A7H0GJC5_9BURK|nr:hypothetical protein [Diaphorobacter aerolatus]QNP48391.1 hypothetical protein H9K75_20950 [Diaphorobacter aerolatus]